MKNLLISLWFLIFCYTGIAQDNSWLWPVKGNQSGENILFKPQTYIAEELNFGKLFIGATIGNEVISPADGVITSFFYMYFESLENSTCCKVKYLNDEKERVAFANRKSKPIDPQYISVSLGIRTNSGKIIYICGLRPAKFFKTGEKITKGEVIGRVGYVYYKIPKPCISISVSENGKPADPMSPFGLKTSFINPKNIKCKEVLSVEEIKSDLIIFADALKEGHPGLYDYISKIDFEALIQKSLSSIKQPMSTTDFKSLLTTIISSIRDSHLNILSTTNLTSSTKEIYIPTISLGWLNDSLVVNRTIESDKNYLGRKVIEVDGITADSLKSFLSSYHTRSDGYVESYPDFVLLTVGELRYFRYHPKASKKRNLNLTFVNGEIVTFKGEKIRGKACMNLQPIWRNYYLANKYKTANFQLKKLSNQTAYIGLGTFDLNEIEMEEIASYVKAISDSSYQHLIIDVRNNYGGNEQNVIKLFALIAQQPFSLVVSRKINNKDSYQFFDNCLNYDPESGEIFSNYFSIEGKDGFYSVNDSSSIILNPINNFKGKVYVLTNERSFSASTIFPALVHKHKRGIVVGRETGSTYYHMNAEKFADLRLPNSCIVIQIPLVQIVFDTIPDPSIPWGRGVMPDYSVNFTLSELAWENGDSILNYTRELIKKEKYLPEEKVTLNKEHINETVTTNNHNYLYVLIGIFVLGLILYYFNKNSK